MVTLTFPSDLRIARQGNFVTTDWDKCLVSLGKLFTQISVRDSSTEATREHLIRVSEAEEGFATAVNTYFVISVLAVGS